MGKKGIKIYTKVFPSPIGELHFSIDNDTPEDIDIARFRPLSGSYISQ